MRLPSVRPASLAIAAATVIGCPVARAQTPAVTGYSEGTLDQVWADYMSDGAPGFLFRTTGPIAVTGLSVFNPAVTGGGTTLGGTLLSGARLATSYTAYLYGNVTHACCIPGHQHGTLLATATITGSSSARAATSGPPGAFWTTTLPTPVMLSGAGLYGVFAAGDDGLLMPFYIGSGGAAPVLDPRIRWAMDAGAQGASGSIWMNDAVTISGGSFDFVTATPEPATWLLTIPGALMAAAARRRRRLDG